ncbi:MAG: efflux transporter outer membrane subunit [Desulfuromonadaceae bacterium]|nr:efflux transporter outer membrane subunit [Desulfuromonas sp.]MDY0185572.1 efflux transporter outer membrane subunit [Desulfuromonadaceae bacterium]
MRNIFVLLTYLLLTNCMLTGCMIGPDYVRPEIETPEQWTIEYQTAVDLANTRWWQQFGDPMLDSMIEASVRGNLDLKLATARVEQYLGVLDTTRSQMFPQITGGFAPSAQRAAGVTSENYPATLNGTWEIDVWGKIRRSTEAAQAQILASEAGRRTVLMTVVSNVASAYLTLRGLDRQLEIAQVTETIYADSLKLFQLRFKYGSISQLELFQAESQYESARQAIPAYESLIKQQENLLALLLGRAPAAIPRGKPLDLLTPIGIPEGLPSTLLERRPDIIQAEQSLVAANANIGAAKAAYFPNLSLTGAFGVASSDLDSLFSSGTTIWSNGGQLVAPLLNFGKISGQVKQAEAIQQQALHQYHMTVLTGFKEVEDALVKNIKGKEQFEALKRQVKALEEYVRISRLQFEAGTTNYLQVLDAERSLFTGRLSLAQTKYDLLVAGVSVYKAMGGGWIAEADSLLKMVD